MAKVEHLCPDCHAKFEEPADENVHDEDNGDAGVDVKCPECGEWNPFLAVWYNKVTA